MERRIQMSTEMYAKNEFFEASRENESVKEISLRRREEEKNV